jgi:two-component system CheB/CheR fusion protein
VRRTAEDHRSAFTRDRIDLQAAIPDAPLWIVGYYIRIAQVVGNLLQNSAKFTPAGGKATVSVEANVGFQQAVIRVRDTGAGIAPDTLPCIFEPFTQADTTLDRSKGGLGLGLALVKGLVEMHGGTGSVESEGVGKGAEFTVRLPLESGMAPSAAPPTSGARQNGRTRRVLVIEDNVDAADSLREVLELAEHTVEVAYSGPAGIELARDFKPDVVLCDIGLPGMDGYEVARAMRADPALHETTLVALTGYGAPEDIAKTREAGFGYHLAKPPSVEKIEEALAVRTAATSPGPGPGAP